MTHFFSDSLSRFFSRCGTTLLAAALSLICLSATTAAAADTTATGSTGATGAAALQEKYQSLQTQLAHNQFARPIYLNSSESSSALKGDIYALVDYPFAQVRGALTQPAQWCDVLILHLNTKYCRATVKQNPASLSMRIGKKNDQALDDAYRIDFSYRLAADNADYFDIRLNSDKGPLDTRDYRIQLEAIPVGDGRSFLHLTYSYAYGFASRVAIRAYLATAGSNKVGFTLQDNSDKDKPSYVGGMRGTVERNTMRYYLAIDAYLSGLATPPAQQLEQRLQTWFASTERYPRQLHEVDKADYLTMKRKEYARQNSDKTPD